MHKWQKNSVCLAIVAALFFLISFTFNKWFSQTMPRHQLLQLPVMILLGIFLAINFSKINISDIYYGISTLIFVMTSLVFWMLPRSIDLASTHIWANRIMHLNMLVVGFASVIVLRKIDMKVKIVFLEMLAAMVAAVGITLHSFNKLLCSSFNLYQQRETGFYLMIAGFTLFIATIVLFFISLEKAGKQAQ